ncbi:MAG: DUF481 domain-containing protein [Kordiimonadaceae bacterium]|nr:DUF481 domain-containing protein [Kordiimonadaceae bacterium]
MTTNICKTALAVGLFCLPMFPISSYADVSPEQFNLLMVASKKDGGKDFQTLVELLVSANPDDEAEIRNVAAQIMPQPAPEPEPAPAASPSPVEGTIFSDRGAEQFSQAFLPGWDKSIEVNGLFTTGNTQQKSFGTAAKLHRESGPYQQTIATYFDYNTSNGVTNKRRYGVSFKNDYSISDISYITGFASFEGDSYGAFNKRLTMNAGYGLRVFDNDTYKWNVEAGPAVLMTKPIATDGYETDITGYASSLFTWNVNDRSDFENESKIFMGSKLVVENKAAYTMKVSGALSGKLSFDVLYNRDAPVGRKKTDTITRIGVLYDF